MDAISHEKEYREEIDSLNEQCFPGWQHRKKGMGNDEEKDEEKDEEGDKAIEDTDEPFDIGEIRWVLMQMEMNRYYCMYFREGEGEINQWTCRMCLKEFK